MSSKFKTFGATALALALGLAGASAGAQEREGTSRKDRGFTSAPVPQYWIADAALFIANANNVAEVLSKEQELSVQEPEILGNQAEFMVDATERALSSLEELLENAERTNPDAVPPIRDAIAELQAARRLASAVAEAAADGELGPTYEVTVRSALRHLEEAEDAMGDIAKEYSAGNLGVIRGRGGSSRVKSDTRRR